MKNLRRGIILLTVFMVGCFAATVMQPLIVPPLHAQQEGVVTKWEYHCIGHGYAANEITAEFNKMGAQGWELVANVGSSNSAFNTCFKRQLL